jgi:hypothetical protein
MLDGRVPVQNYVYGNALATQSGPDRLSQDLLLRLRDP